MEGDYGGLFNRGPCRVNSQSTEAQLPKQYPLVHDADSITAGVEAAAAILMALEKAPSWKADFDNELSTGIGQPQEDLLALQDLKGDANSTPATTCTQSECEGGVDFHGFSPRPYSTSVDSIDFAEFDTGAVFVSTPHITQSTPSPRSCRASFKGRQEAWRHLQEREDFRVFDVGAEFVLTPQSTRSPPNLTFRGKSARATCDSERKGSVAAVNALLGPNGRKVDAEAKLAEDQKSFFHVQMPEPYSGLWCRRSKQLSDIHRCYASQGTLVSGHVEDDGEWLRIDSDIFLPMRMGNVDILEPVPPASMEFGLQDWLTSTTRAFAQFIGWGGGTSHDVEDTGWLLSSCGYKVSNDTIAFSEDAVCHSTRADMVVVGTKQRCLGTCN